MATIGELNVRIGAKIEGLQKGIAKVERRLNRFSRRTGQIGDSLSRSITLPIIGIGAAAIKTAGDFEQLTNGLASIMGSSAAAAKEIKLLKDEAKKPGLDLTQAVKGSVRLQSVGVDANLARQALSNFGNAIALAGGSSSDLDGVTLALTQIISKGKISAEEINQLAERVPQVRKAIETAFGTGDSEALQKLGVSAEEFVEKVTLEMGKLPQATGGIKNSINNAGQAITQFLVTIGNDINKSFNVTDKIAAFADWLGGLADKFAELDSGTKEIILTIVAFAAAVGPAFKIVSLLTSATASLGSAVALAATPLGLLTVGLTLAYAAYKTLTVQTDATTQAQNNLAAVNKKAQKSIAAEKVALDQLRHRINDVNSSKEDQKKAINELIAVNPKYFEGLDKEKTTLEEINSRLDGYLEKILQRAKLAASQERLIEIEKRFLDIEKERVKAGATIAKNQSALITGNVIFQAKAIDGLKELQEEEKGLNLERERLIKNTYELEKATANFIKTSTVTPKKPGATPTQKPTSGGDSSTSNEVAKLREGFTALNPLVKEFQLTQLELNLSIPTNNLQFQEGTQKITKLAAAYKELGRAASTVGAAMVSTAQQGASSFAELGKAALTAAADVVRAHIMEGVTGYMKNVLAGSGLFGLILAPAAGAAAGAVFNSALQKIKVPAFADGVQNFSGGAALVGERGPEIVSLPRGANVTPNKESMRMMGGGNMNINITGRLIGEGSNLVAVIDETRYIQNRNGI